MGEVNSSFRFAGKISASKSLMNRALIIQSYNSDLKLEGESNCEDVLLMQQGLRDLLAGRPVFCGQAGTVLRFLALRASRLKGCFFLRGTERLMQRLPEGLVQVLSQLGSEVEIKGNELRIESQGWHLRGDGLWIPSSESSQFASAVLLNAWDIKYPLHFVLSGFQVSKDYFQMTLDMVRAFGLKVSESGREFSIDPKQNPVGKNYLVECDVSSAFAVAALAAIAGEAEIKNFPKSSVQPDSIFIQYLIQMGIPLRQEDQSLFVNKATSIKGIKADLRNCPDVFPVLAVLAALASGPSQFTGIEHLVHKESNRLENTKNLLRAMGAKLSQGEALVIEPAPKRNCEKIIFDPDQDHRMAMAAAVAKKAGFPIEILNPQVVDKSFPEFWSVYKSQ